ncbi:MAG: hypothetical protein KAT70_01830, partial [Thermoplasmata archaeon]|nr:hypothetical protein [Thermoplasmata archaeon]
DTPDTPVVFGVKEMPLDVFKSGTTYIFFSHVIKGQDYNMPMLRHMMGQGCGLIDYEKIADEHGRRLVFFGREAGQAGMIDTLWALGRRLEYEGWTTPFSDIEQTISYEGLEDVKAHLAKIGEKIHMEGLPEELCPLIVGFAGYGNVSLGAQDVFDVLPHETITPKQALALKKEGEYSNNVLYKVVFKEKHMAELKGGGEFELQDYYQHPEKYRGIFAQYVSHLTVLMNCIYWEERYPRLVTKAQIKELFTADEHPTFRVVGDISCDYEGSIEATIHSTDSDHPTFVYDPFKDVIIEGKQGRGLTIMAVDNLPAELPREASIRFSKSLESFVEPMAKADYTVPFKELELPPEIKRALVLHQGKLTPDFEYIASFL